MGFASSLTAHLSAVGTLSISQNATTVATFERNGHPDHDTAGEVAREVACQSSQATSIQCSRSQLCERPGGAIVPPHVLPYFNRPYEVFML
jgi:LmbE family N-acetylglucosaminyl deacetylase